MKFIGKVVMISNSIKVISIIIFEEPIKEF